jgi:hypothetical protein
MPTPAGAPAQQHAPCPHSQTHDACPGMAGCAISVVALAVVSPMTPAIPASARYAAVTAEWFSVNRAPDPPPPRG